MICEAGVLLKVSQVVVATAQNMFHRFYWRKSLTDARFDAFSVAMGCMLLASKVEEVTRRLRDILYVFHLLYRRRKFSPGGEGGGGGDGEASMGLPQRAKDARKATFALGGDRYSRWKQAMVSMERHLLKELGFGFYQVMEHPHKFLLYYIQYLRKHG